MRALLLAVRFGSELALLVALAVIGANVAAGLLAVVGAVVLPALAAWVWPCSSPRAVGRGRQIPAGRRWRPCSSVSP